MTDWPYDIETFPNCFTLAIKPIGGECRVFEISPRIDERQAMMQFIMGIDGRMVGYNNLGFDYPVLHYIMCNPHVTVRDIYEKAMSIIFGNDRFGHMVWESDWLKPQVDLYKIHHFDNANRATSLKMLEFNMRSESIQDLPFPAGTELTYEQMDELRTYNVKDVVETEKFYHQSLDRISFREELSERYGKNFLNHNDTKIGKDYFIMQLGEDLCYSRDTGRREPRQTPRHSGIRLADAIFPYIRFEQPEFQRIHQWLQQQTIYETKGVFKNLVAVINGFEFVFGAGGIHGSVESTTLYSDDEYVIDDRDVASYYPNLAIVNKVFPEHLGEQFCKIYKDVYEQRKTHAKGSAQNAMLKLALNGVYGDSNNIYSPFYDPLYTMKITINGQLLLCILAEQLMKVPGLTMVQINTDGLTTRYPRRHTDMVNRICEWWEQYSLLQLESVEYTMMAIKNVNSYLAVTTDGKIKRKKDYCTLGAHTGKGSDLDWHQPHSALVVPMAAEAYLLFGIDPEQFIRAHANVMDFMLVIKVPRNSSLEIGGQQVQNITRYYVSTNGQPMYKIMPPAAAKYEWTLRNPETNKVKVVKSQRGVDSSREKGFTEVLKHVQLPPQDRHNAVCKGWLVNECNDMKTAGDVWGMLNYDYYIAEAKKLVDPLRVVG